MEQRQKRQSMKYVPVSIEKLNKAFEALRNIFGSHKAVANGMGIPERTYLDWRKRGVPNRFTENMIISYAADQISHMQAGLNGSLPKQHKESRMQVKQAANG